jgi:hypothetical protein
LTEFLPDLVINFNPNFIMRLSESSRSRIYSLPTTRVTARAD